MEEDEKTLVMFPNVKPIVPPDGPKWRPSNSSEAALFDRQWCCRCSKQGNGEDTFCPIQTASVVHPVDDQDYPREWQIRNGRPVCTAWEGK